MNCGQRFASGRGNALYWCCSPECDREAAEILNRMSVFNPHEVDGE